MPPPLLDYLTTHEPLFRASRLPSLYSDLSVQKTSNPEGYTANVSAWTAALTRAALAKQLPPEQNLLVLQSGDALLDALASPTYGRPSGLGCVLDECVRQGIFVDLKDFLAAENSIYARSWVPSPWAVVRWGLRQAGLSWGASYEGSGGRLKQGRLVLVPALEEVWKLLVPVVEARGQGLTDRVVSRDVFVKEVSGLLARNEGKEIKTATSISEQDLQVLLRYLSRDKHILAYDNNTIKFKSPTSTNREPITQEDHSIASLKSLIQDLEQQKTTLSTRISTLQTQATIAVKSGNKPTAISSLRSKKLAERTLQQRLDTLAQLEEIYTKIEAAVSQVDILAVMESSATSLKSLNKKVGGVERVEDVLESLREEVGKVDEVSTVLAEPGAVDQKALLDEADVEDELEQMEKEEREKVRKAEEEKTRERLREMDALEQARKETQRERAKEREMEAGQPASRPEIQTVQENTDFESALSSSIEDMRKLGIGDPRREKETADRTGERSTQQQSDPAWRRTQEQGQLVAEGAS